jgi:hypothetical protein
MYGRGVENTANNMGNGVVDSFSNLGKSLFPWLRAPEATASQQSKREKSKRFLQQDACCLLKRARV